MNKEKKLYEAPSFFIMEVKSEGVICTSSVDPSGLSPVFNDPFGSEQWL